MNKLSRKFISGMLTLMMIFTLVSGTGTKQVFATGNDSQITEARASLVKAITKAYSEKDNENWLKSKYGQGFIKDESETAKVDPNEVVRVIVQLTDKPVAEAGAKKLQSLQAAQNTIKAKSKTLKNVEIRHTYTNLINGFSMTIVRSEIDKVKAMSGVKSVTQATKYYPDMTTAKSLTQTYEAWNNPNFKVKGEGMVVSIIDTGIDWEHKDMILSNSTNEKLTNKTPVGPGKYYSEKVPYGYNYAEMNSDVKDTGTMHGMHVAGIVGANGPEAEVAAGKAIQGVAPECQLLAMKVFANDDAIGGAYTDDIIAAIEDSVKQGADVINMSLGSNSGFQDADQPEQKAIKNATDKGVMVVVSAGNSQYNTAPYKFGELYDTGVVGSPGLTKDTLQVASSENSNLTATSFEYEISGVKARMLHAFTEAPKDPAVVFKGQKLQLVDCGQGGILPEDYQGKDLTGKIAVVEWGHGLGSKGLRTAAMNAGAAGAIIYGPAGDEAMHGMYVDSTLVPAAWVAHSDGLKLIDGIATGITVSFDGKQGNGLNPNANDMSDFTSWGPTPSLDFKPEITAPGGNIWSTVNNNNYENMSGTSMAAPHASGAEALVMQAIKKSNPSITGRDLVELAKTTSINTSKTLMDKAHPAVPYSPRRQGAGIVQINDAITNLVTITDTNGSAAVALKEIEKTKTFTLNLKNYDATPVTYTIGDIGGVLTEQNEGFITSMSYDVKIAGATTTFDNNSVTVPSNGTATVNVTITLPNDFATEQFVEGFIKFTSTDKPSLVVPYMGFYGDWSSQETIDKPVWDPECYFGYTEMLTLGDDNNTLNYLGFDGKDKDGNTIINPNKIAISPNGDGMNDNAFPLLSFLRNAKTMNVQVLDKDNKIVAQIAADSNIRKNVFAEKNKYNQSMNWMWDGKVLNPATGEMEAAKDGQYNIDYVTKVDSSTAKEQHFTIPVKVDLTAPEILLKSSTSSDSTTYKLEWEVNDILSGDAGISGIVLNGVEQKGIKVTNTEGVYSCDLTLEKDTINTIDILTADNALNIAMKTIMIKEGSVPFTLTFDNLESRMLVNKVDLKVTGSVSYVPGEFKINGLDVDIKDDLTFSTDLKFVEGRNTVLVYVVDIDGTTKLKDFSYKLDCDTIAPVLTLTSPIITSDGKAHTDKGIITIAGNVSDNTIGYKLYINGNQKMSVELDGEAGNAATEKSFSYEVPVTNNSNIIIKVVDLFGNETIKNINVVIDVTVPVITTSVEEGKIYNVDVTPVITTDDNADIVTMTLNEKLYNGEAITKDGNYKLIVTAVDLAGNSSTMTVSFIIDKIAPIITVTGVEAGKTYNTNVTPVFKANKGTVTATLNGIEYNGKEITAEGNYKLIVTAVDLAGNSSTITVSFTIDKPAPITTQVTDSTIIPKTEVNEQRLSGADRIATSIAIAKEQYKTTKPDAVVLATSNEFADALAGSGLAYKNNAPLLLVNKTVKNSQAVLDYINTNLSKEKNVYILGGTGVVSKEIEDYLTAQGYKVIRLGGRDRYETNQKIVDYLNVAKGTSMVIATGNDFADALSISSIADIKGFPVLLNSKNNLSDSTSDYITKLQPTTVYIAGGTGVISANIEAQIKKLNTNIQIVRLGGTDRYETSMMILEHFNLPTTTIAVATGKDFPDALSGSVLAARNNCGVLLLDNKNVSKQKALLSKQKITKVIIFGGEAVISNDILKSLF
ncbi:cell wall-binding repeat-containing protein [Clostridium sp.]|uniref:cell wall-binding repeat-containing protein n=1 Tax=Clostridium sp. TaxID=1506 RepID=UPI003D6D6FA8